jgi:hypothetical protein
VLRFLIPAFAATSDNGCCRADEAAKPPVAEGSSRPESAIHRFRRCPTDDRRFRHSSHTAKHDAGDRIPRGFECNPLRSGA